MPRRRKGFQSPGLLSLGEKMGAARLKEMLGCRPGLEDPAGMRGPSPRTETPEPLGPAVDGNEPSEFLSCCPLTKDHSVPKTNYDLLLIMCQALVQGLYTYNSFNLHNTFLFH